MTYAERCAPLPAAPFHLPRGVIDLPDRARLERRYEQFRGAAG